MDGGSPAGWPGVWGSWRPASSLQLAAFDISSPFLVMYGTSAPGFTLYTSPLVVTGHSLYVHITLLVESHMAFSVHISTCSHRQFSISTSSHRAFSIHISTCSHKTFSKHISTCITRILYSVHIPTYSNYRASATDIPSCQAQGIGETHSLS